MSAPNVMQRDAAARQNPSGLTLPLPSPLLAMLPPQLQGLDMQWWEFPIIMLAVPPLGSKTQQFTTDKNHAFAAFWGSLKVRSSDNQTDRDADPAATTMTDTQNLAYQPPGVVIDIANTFGNAKQPAIWPVPLIVKTNNGIILTVTNQSNANTNNYNFCFAGALIVVPPTIHF
jgi:hypothetical protein